MNRILSLYFDGWRLMAALLVFFYHSGFIPEFSSGLVAGRLGLLDDKTAHLAVVVFFVLSGFLIAQSAGKTGMTWTKYLSARLARMYSVLVPALLLTAAAMAILNYRLPDTHARFLGNGWQPVRYIVNLLFLQQLWTFCVVPGMLVPIWSIGYEWGYYMLLGVWQYATERRWKALGLAGVAIMLGPKILLLFPAWAVGALAQWAIRRKFVCNPQVLWSVFLVTTSILLFILCQPRYLIPWNPRIGQYPLYYSYNFIIDDCFALVVGINFWALGSLDFRSSVFEREWGRRLGDMITYGAGISFSIYLYHVPLFYVLGALRGRPYGGLRAESAGLALCLALVAGLAQITERRLGFWRTRVDRSLALVRGRFAPALMSGWSTFSHATRR